MGHACARLGGIADVEIGPLTASERVMRPRYYLILAALTVIAFVIRWRIATSSGLWRDEALFLFITQSSSWSAMLDFLRFHESHPPLFYALMRVWIHFAGASDRGALLPPVLLGAALVPTVFFLTRRFFGARVAWVACVITAFSPPLAGYSGMVRPYSFLPLAVLCSSSILVFAIATGKRRLWLAYAGSILILVLTHNWSFLVVAGQAVATLFVARKAQRPMIGVIGDFSFAAALAGFIYSPWIPALLSQSRNAGNGPLPVETGLDYLRLAFFGILSVVQATLGGLAERETKQVLVFSLPLALLALVAVRLSEKNAETPPSVPVSPSVADAHLARMAVGVFMTTTITAAVLAIGLSAYSSLLVNRCIAMLAPLVIVVLARLFVFSYDRTRFTRHKRAIAAALAVVLAGDYAAGLLAFMRPRSDAREFASTLEQQVRPNDLIILTPVWMASSFNRYFAANVEQIDFPDRGRRGAVDFSNMRERISDSAALSETKARVEAARRQHSRVWLVTEGRYFRTLNPGEVRRSAGPRQYELMGKLRLLEIRDHLIREFGSPATTVVAPGSNARLEQFTALLFSSDNF